MYIRPSLWRVSLGWYGSYTIQFKHFCMIGSDDFWSIASGFFLILFELCACFITIDSKTLKNLVTWTLNCSSWRYNCASSSWGRWLAFMTLKEKQLPVLVLRWLACSYDFQLCHNRQIFMLAQSVLLFLCFKRVLWSPKTCYAFLYKKTWRFFLCEARHSHSFSLAGPQEDANAPASFFPL